MDDYMAWDECPETDSCELIQSFLELVESMVRDIQHLKAETIRARYELSREYDPERDANPPKRNFCVTRRFMFFRVVFPNLSDIVSA